MSASTATVEPMPDQPTHEGEGATLDAFVSQFSWETLMQGTEVAASIGLPEPELSGAGRSGKSIRRIYRGVTLAQAATLADRLEGLAAALDGVPEPTTRKAVRYMRSDALRIRSGGGGRGGFNPTTGEHDPNRTARKLRAVAPGTASRVGKLGGRRAVRFALYGTDAGANVPPEGYAFAVEGHADGNQPTVHLVDVTEALEGTRRRVTAACGLRLRRDELADLVNGGLCRICQGAAGIVGVPLAWEPDPEGIDYADPAIWFADDDDDDEEP